MMDDSIRVSDADRDRVIAQLNEHFAVGRITPAELDERLSAALNAKTFGNLRPIMADLPRPVSAPRGAARHPQRITPAGVVRRPPFPPLILLALFAVILIPANGWLLAVLLDVILLFWLMTFVAGAFAFGRSQRGWHHHRGGRQLPRYPSGRHYTWL